MHESKVILIVEDDEPIRESLKEVLEQEGYEVLTATNGSDGLRVLEKAARRPSLILLDLFMPVMSGLDFLRVIRAQDQRSITSSPIILLSASPPDGEAAKEAAPFTQGFIKKPVDLYALLSSVEKYCG
jgi:CheY-like chemotaxis protein